MGRTKAKKAEKIEKQRKEISKLRRELNELKKMTKERTMTLLTSALGFVAALFWRDAFKAAIEQTMGVAPGQGPWIIQVGVAMLVTIITVVALYSLTKTLEE